MATNTTFSTLKDDITNYLERGYSATSDPVVAPQIPRLINLAERNIARELKVLGFVNVVTTTFTDGTSVYAKPDRWRATVSINIGAGAGNTTRTTLFPRSYEYVRAYWPDESVEATPEFYADYNEENWLIAPTPDADYPAEIVYYELPDLLSDTNQTNWLTAKAPQLLLYRCLWETAMFLKDDQAAAQFQAQYDRAAAMLEGEDLSRIFDRAVIRKEA